MDRVFLRAAFAGGSEIGPFRLRAFSLAHRVALTAIGSPLMAENAEITPADLLVAIRICESDTPLTVDLGAPCWRHKVAALMCSLSKRHFRRLCSAFVAYIDEHAAGPKVLQRDDMVKPSTIPWPMAVVAGLVRNGIEESRAWSMPEALAVWYHLAFAEAAGAEFKIWNDDFAEVAEMMKRKAKK